MTFTEFVRAILESYVSENPALAAIYADQIGGIVSFRNEINGYGAYSHFTLKPGCLRFSGDLARGYAKNDYLVEMEGRRHGLGFSLSITDGLIDSLEIYPSDGEGWDGVVRPFQLRKSATA
jgi:hypothetical protein